MRTHKTIKFTWVVSIEMIIESIEYMGGLIQKPSQRKKLKINRLSNNQIDKEMVEAIEENNVLSVSGTLGMREGGSPIQYEYVKISSSEGSTEFEVYNRAMSMFMDETAELKSVFSLCTKLQLKFRH